MPDLTLVLPTDYRLKNGFIYSLKSLCSVIYILIVIALFTLLKLETLIICKWNKTEQLHQ